MRGITKLIHKSTMNINTPTKNVAPPSTAASNADPCSIEVLGNLPVPETAEILAGHCCERLQRGERFDLEEYLSRPALERESAAVEFLALVNTYRLLAVHETLALEDEAGDSVHPEVFETALARRAGCI